MIRHLAFYFLILMAMSCDSPTIHADVHHDTARVATDEQSAETIVILKSATEKYLDSLGLVNVYSLDSSLRIDIRYSTADNFIGKDLYGDFAACYLQKDVAEKLIIAHRLLHNRFPYYRFVIYDGARPVSIQQMMWDSVDLPPAERQKYLSNPGNYSLHNFGAAVDLSIEDEDGRELDMGTPYDYFGTEAHPRNEQTLFSEGKLTAVQIMNRELLRGVMRDAGFSGIETEWWHFNSCSRVRATEIYPLVK